MRIDATGAAILALFLGCGLAVYGVYLLAGMGWACLAGAMPLLLLGLVLLRGLAVMTTQDGAPRG